jgi:hypothetical protein
MYTITINYLLNSSLPYDFFEGRKKGLKINQEVLSSSKKLSEWLNKNKRKSEKA